MRIWLKEGHKLRYVAAVIIGSLWWMMCTNLSERMEERRRIEKPLPSICTTVEGVYGGKVVLLEYNSFMRIPITYTAVMANSVSEKRFDITDNLLLDCKGIVN